MKKILLIIVLILVTLPVVVNAESNTVLEYDFTNYTIIAPWWRIELAADASFSLANCLNFTGGTSILSLHETVGYKSVILEIARGAGSYGIRFIDNLGKPWGIEWRKDTLWFYHAENTYGKNQSWYKIINTNMPTKLGVGYKNSSSIEYYLETNDSSLKDFYTTSFSIPEPQYIQLFFLSGNACFSKLYVAHTLDDILYSTNITKVKEDDWYSPYLNFSITLDPTIPQRPLLYGVRAFSIDHTGSPSVKFDGSRIDEMLEFSKGYGFNAVRLELYWSNLMPSIGEWNETVLEWIRDFTQRANNRGFHVVLNMLQYNLAYVSFEGEGNDEWLNYLMDNSSLRSNYVQTWLKIVEHVKDLDVSYMPFNEPDPAESAKDAGLIKLFGFYEEIGKTIRNIDTEHMIWIGSYQWQDRHQLWATKNVSFNFTNYGFDLHVYPTDQNIDRPTLGYDPGFISWLKERKFPIIVSETSISPLAIDAPDLKDFRTWQISWYKQMSFIFNFTELRGVISVNIHVGTIKANTRSRAELAQHLLEAFFREWAVPNYTTIVQREGNNIKLTGSKIYFKNSAKAVFDKRWMILGPGVEAEINGQSIKTFSIDQNFVIRANCTGDNTIDYYNSNKPTKIKINGNEIFYDDSLSTTPSWKYDETNKIITIKFSC